MTERNQFDRLDAVIDAILDGRVMPIVDGDLAALALVAADLRDLPDPQFRDRLRRELLKENDMTTTMTATVQHMIPCYLIEGAAGMIEFLEKTFDAEVLQSHASPEGKVMYAEVKVGDSTIELGDANEQWTAKAAPLHVYIPDVDAVYARALAAGATSIYEPMQQPYGDREAGVTDPFGIEWYLATRLEGGPRPPGFGTVTAGFRTAGAPKLLEFLVDAFGAVEVDRTSGPSGEIRHAEIRLGATMIELSEAHGQWGPTKGAYHVIVDDCDAMYERALRAGATSVAPPETKPYGERSAAVDDPFGNQWYIAMKIA